MTRINCQSCDGITSQQCRECAVRKNELLAIIGVSILIVFTTFIIILTKDITFKHSVIWVGVRLVIYYLTFIGFSIFMYGLIIEQIPYKRWSDLDNFVKKISMPITYVGIAASVISIYSDFSSGWGAIPPSNLTKTLMPVIAVFGIFISYYRRKKSRNSESVELGLSIIIICSTIIRIFYASEFFKSLQ